MDDNGGDDRELSAIRKHQGRGQEERRVAAVLLHVKKAVGGDDGRDVVGQTEVVECARRRDGEVRRVEEVGDCDRRQPSGTRH